METCQVREHRRRSCEEKELTSHTNALKFNAFLTKSMKSDRQKPFEFWHYFMIAGGRWRWCINCNSCYLCTRQKQRNCLDDDKLYLQFEIFLCSKTDLPYTSRMSPPLCLSCHLNASLSIFSSMESAFSSFFSLLFDKRASTYPFDVLHIYTYTGLLVCCMPFSLPHTIQI